MNESCLIYIRIKENVANDWPFPEQVCMIILRFERTTTELPSIFTWVEFDMMEWHWTPA